MLFAVKDAYDGDTIVINPDHIQFAHQFGDMILISVADTNFYTRTLDMPCLIWLCGADHKHFDEQAAATET